MRILVQTNSTNEYEYYYKITRLRACPAPTSRDFWLLMKPLVQPVESEDGVLIIDDRISHKPGTDEHEIVCGYDDHTTGQLVKGINFITALYQTEEVSLPTGVQLIAKTEYYTDPKAEDWDSIKPVPKSKDLDSSRLVPKSKDLDSSRLVYKDDKGEWA